MREYHREYFAVGWAVVIALLLAGLARLAYIVYIWRRSRPRSPIANAIFAGLVGAATIAVAVNLAMLYSSSGAHAPASASAYVTVPEVKREDYLMALGALADAGVKPVAHFEGSRAPLDTGIRTRPPTGQRVRRDSTVTAVLAADSAAGA